MVEENFFLTNKHGANEAPSDGESDECNDEECEGAEREDCRAEGCPRCEARGSQVHAAQRVLDVPEGTSQGPGGPAGNGNHHHSGERCCDGERQRQRHCSSHGQGSRDGVELQRAVRGGGAGAADEGA